MNPPQPPPAMLSPKKEHVFSETPPVFHQAPRVESPQSRTRDEALEFKVGSKLFTGVGALAVLFGVGFFLRYAFENNLITPVMRIVLGFAGGLLLLGVGEWARKKYPLYSQIVSGGGLGVFYLTLYAAFEYYELMADQTAFIGMIVVTALGVYLSVRYDSLPLAVFAQVGGFLTPILVSSGSNNPHALFLYTALLNVGIFAVALQKFWRLLVWLGLAGTAFLYGSWLDLFYTNEQFLVTEGYGTLFFAIFVAVSFVLWKRHGASNTGGDIAFVTLVPAGYFLVSFTLMNELYPDITGLFTAGLSAFYLLLATAIPESESRNLLFRQTLGGISLVLAALAIPIQFEKHAITIGWAAEAGVLTYLGFQLKSKNMRYFSMGLFMLVFIRLLIFDSQLNAESFLWNSRALSHVVTFLFLGFSTLLYWKNQEDLIPEEAHAISFLLIKTAAVFTFGVTHEILDFFSPRWLSGAWASVGLLLLLAAFFFKSYHARFVALLVLLLGLGRILFFDLTLLDGANAFINARSFALLYLGVMVFLAYALFDMFRNRVSESEYDMSLSLLLFEMYVILFALVSAEINDFFPKYWLSVSWSVLALGGIWVSLSLKNTVARWAGYLTFIAVGVRLFLEEGVVRVLAYTPIWNSRVFAFLVAVCAAGGALYLLRKKGRDVSENETRLAEPIFFLGINFFLLYLVSREVWDFFEQQYRLLGVDVQLVERTRFANLKNVALSVAWTLYAIGLLVLGILKRSVPARFFAIALFGIVIFKVFLYDTSSLSNAYRFVSFLTLGVILLLAGYLYNRFKERIIQFIQIENSR